MDSNTISFNTLMQFMTNHRDLSKKEIRLCAGWLIDIATKSNKKMKLNPEDQRNFIARLKLGDDVDEEAIDALTAMIEQGQTQGENNTRNTRFGCNDTPTEPALLSAAPTQTPAVNVPVITNTPAPSTPEATRIDLVDPEPTEEQPDDEPDTTPITPTALPEKVDGPIPEQWVMTPEFVEHLFNRVCIRYNNNEPIGIDTRRIYEDTWVNYILPALGAKPFENPDTFKERFFITPKPPRVKEFDSRHKATKALIRNLTDNERAMLLGDNATRIDNIVTEIYRTVIKPMKEQDDAEGRKPTPNMLECGRIDWAHAKDAVITFAEKVLASKNPTALIIRRAIIGMLYFVTNDPRRREYAIIIFGNGVDPEKDNCYIDGRIILNKYKTAPTYGPYEIIVDERTKRLIELLIPKCKMHFLFFDKEPKDAEKKTEEERDKIRHNLWTGNVRSAFMQIYNKPLQPSTLRKFYHDYEMASERYYPDQIRERARRMGTSPEELYRSYTVKMPESATSPTATHSSTTPVVNKPRPKKRATPTRGDENSVPIPKKTKKTKKTKSNAGVIVIDEPAVETPTTT